MRRWQQLHGPADRTINVVAGANFWGDIAAQLGGGGVKVISIVTDSSPPADRNLAFPTITRRLLGRGTASAA